MNWQKVASKLRQKADLAEEQANFKRSGNPWHEEGKRRQEMEIERYTIIAMILKGMAEGIEAGLAD